MIKPFGKNIYFKPNKQKTVLETTNERLTDTGKVIAVGDEVEKIKVGDGIAFNGYGAWTVKINGEDYHFCKEDSDIILCTYAE